MPAEKVVMPAELKALGIVSLNLDLLLFTGAVIVVQVQYHFLSYRVGLIGLHDGTTTITIG